MVRILKRYDETIKAAIYAPLGGQAMRFDEWARKTGKNKATLNEYRFHGIEVGEIGKEGNKYVLTPKGLDELERMRSRQAINQQDKFYGGRVDSSNELDSSLSVDGLLEPAEYILPLPLPIDASVYGTEEMRFVFERGEDHLLYHNGVSPRNVSAEVLKGAVQGIAKQFVWSYIIERVWHLMLWHNVYVDKDGKQKPPPFTIDSILGFDLSLNVRYNGRALTKTGKTLFDASQIGMQRDRAAKRLVGCLLVYVGFGPWTEVTNANTGDMIPLLEKGGLLEKADATRIRTLLPMIHSWRERTKRRKHKSTIGRQPKPRITEKEREAAHIEILAIALRYLKEGGVLKPGAAATPESIAQEVVSSAFLPW
jgi:hypothetical protein